MRDTQIHFRTNLNISKPVCYKFFPVRCGKQDSVDDNLVWKIVMKDIPALGEEVAKIL